MPQHHHGGDEVMNTAPSTSGSVSPDAAIQPAREHVCPQCKGSVERVRRRIVDRLVSWFSPLHRYRSRTKRHHLPTQALW